MSGLSTRSLSLILGEPLFTGLSLNVEPGERIGLVAANGRGKSSLLRCLVQALDLSRIGKLQRWLAALPRDVAVIAASHDRAFLEVVTKRTLFLRSEGSRQFALPFSTARQALMEADAADDKRFMLDQKYADQLRRQAAKLKNIGINSGSDLLITKTKQLKDRADKIEAAAGIRLDRQSGAVESLSGGQRARLAMLIEGKKLVEVEDPEAFCAGARASA